MGTLKITEELKDANVGKLENYEIGQEVEYTTSSDEFDECSGECSGHWVKIGGVCICNPAPEIEG